MKKVFKNEIGITLVVLIITIIILLILAGITIGQLTGGGLFENAKLAKEKYQTKANEEDIQIANYNSLIEQLSEGIKGSREMSKEEVVNLINQAVEEKVNSVLSNYTPKKDYDELLEKVSELEENMSIEDLQLDYANKVDIKSYNSSTNKYTVPSTGIIVVAGVAKANNRINMFVNGIAVHVTGFTEDGGVWDTGSYSQIVTKDTQIYFDIENNTVLERAFFIPFK